MQICICEAILWVDGASFVSIIPNLTPSHQTILGGPWSTQGAAEDETEGVLNLKNRATSTTVALQRMP